MTTLSERIEPFCGVHYDPAVVGDLASVVAPPYDLIGEARQRELYERSPFNAVRLELGRDADRYVAARDTYGEWLRNGALHRAAKPAVYLYTQRFEIAGRTIARHGFVARVRAEEYARDRILAHERTFAAAKEDRLRLLAATETNVSSVFGLYAGEHSALNRLCDSALNLAPQIVLTDDLKIHNELRAIESREEIAIVQRELASARVLIADGHHRYETALAYRRIRRRREPAAPPKPFDYVMMTLVGCKDPGLIILPTHRVVHHLDAPTAASFAARAREHFEVESFSDREQLVLALRDHSRGALAVALREGAAMLLLSLKDARALEAAMPNEAAEVRGLDVTMLHALVLDHLCGLGPDAIQAGGIIDYTIDARAAVDAALGGRADGAFLMNPPSIDDVERVCDAGATMPEKSTYFYPKLLTGLVMNPLVDPPLP
ncbi:MAG: DUF1015 domain-containing protein [Candidatus Binataceae bacterium]